MVSDSSNFTIGTSPWDKGCKRRRKAAATALNVPAGFIMEPKPFKVGFKVRHRQKLEQRLRASEEATRGILIMETSGSGEHHWSW